MDNLLSQILYGLSGFLFALFSCRYGTLATARMKVAWQTHGFSLTALLATLPSILFLVIAIFVFPLWLYTRTSVGGFVYLATFIFYSSKNKRK
ncbi:MAG: hypothetical protein RSE47_00095 [Acidaminococcaceae bacterium]